MSLSLEAITLPGLMRGAADVFCTGLLDCAAPVHLPLPALPPAPSALRWHNTLLASRQFRRAHIEIFEVETCFAVLHACILPHLDDPAPIFGFDMVSGQTMATGIFLDFSPSIPGPSVLTLSDAVPADSLRAFRRERERPDWGGIFSREFFAIRPTSDDEVRTAIDLAQRAFLHYLGFLKTAGRADTPQLRVARGQADYAQGQRKNPHTYRMLARYVGAGPARRFIEDVLFPLPPDCNDSDATTRGRDPV